MDAWLTLVGLSAGIYGAWRTVRLQMPRQEPALTIALSVAALEAARRAQGPVEPAHLAHAALFALEREDGPDLSRVREALEAHLDALPSGAAANAPPLGRAVTVAIETAARAAHDAAGPLTLRDVLALLREDAHVATLLDAASQPPPSRPGRIGAPYRAGDAHDLARLVLLDDDVSTMEGVLAVLRESFVKGNAEALHLMLTTHYEGRAVVRRCPRAEADALRARALEHARRLGMPLAIVVESGAAVAPPAKTRPSLAARLRGLLRAGPSDRPMTGTGRR